MTMPLRSAACFYCSRFDPESEDPPRCSSFPDGIPDQIFDAEMAHLVSINGEPVFDGDLPPDWFAIPSVGSGSEV